VPEVPVPGRVIDCGCSQGAEQQERAHAGRDRKASRSTPLIDGPPGHPLRLKKPDWPCSAKRVLIPSGWRGATRCPLDPGRAQGVTAQPYRERRQLLEQLGLDGPRWRVPEAFDDGAALWEAVCEHELEGLVAKRLHEPYLPGERTWVKVKNRAYWRWELEREGAFRSRRSQAATA
jgi:hypothetical protein